MATPSSPSSSAPQAPRTPRRTERGVPDGAVVGLLAVLLGTTALVWTATELGGLAAHGHFPRPLPFLGTAGAIRHLATAPNDLPGAWPGTPTASLPSPPAFWLTFFALLAACLLLLLSAATAHAKRRATHAAAVAARREADGETQRWKGGGPGTASTARSVRPAPPGPRQQRPAPEPVPPRVPGPAAHPGYPGQADQARQPADGGAHLWGPSRQSDPAGREEPAPAGQHHRGMGSARAPERPGRADALGADRAAAAATTPDGPSIPAPADGGHAWGPGYLDAPSAADRLGLDASAPLEAELVPGSPGSAPGPQPRGLRGAADPDAPTALLPSSRAEARPGGATAAGWARGGRGSELRFALPAQGTFCVFAPEAGAAARRALLGGVIAEAKNAPLVVVTPDAELWETRPPYRRAVRFDPQHLGAEDPEAPRGRWAPHSGCAEPAVATARARALLLATERPVADAEEQTVRALAETLLRCWLRAAALGGRPFRHVARWAGGGAGTGRQDAVALLQSATPPAEAAAAAASGEDTWAGQLQAALLRSDPATTAALGRVRAALAAVAELHVLAACTPSSVPQDSAAATTRTPAAFDPTVLDPGALLRDGSAGSLYLLGRSGDGRLREPREGSATAAHNAMPLLSALVDDVVRRAWDSAPEDGSGRRDPAPLFVLDDIAAVAPFPALPQLMADGAARGLRALTLLRSPEQARARWGERAVHSLWTTADHRAVLGPLPQAALAALLASVGATGHGIRQPALGPGELLVLPGHLQEGLPQRFRIEAPEA